MTHMVPEHLSDAQQAFVRAAEALGATEPAAARPLTALPRLSARELDDLVERGLVREAANWSYYVFRPRHAHGTGHAQHPGAVGPVDPRGHLPWTRGRYLRVFLFFVFVLLVPILFLQLTRTP